MSWSVSFSCKDDELVAKVKAALKDLPARADNPTSNRVLTRIEEHVTAMLHHSVKDSVFTVSSSGHYDSDGSGSHQVNVSVKTPRQLAADHVAEASILAERAKNREAADAAAGNVTTAPPPPLETVEAGASATAAPAPEPEPESANAEGVDGSAG